MPKVLFIGAHRINRSPSQRFRFEQYLSFFEQKGFECHLSPLLDAKDDKRFYQEGNIAGKFFVILNAIARRWRDVRRASDYDIIFIQREAFMTGSVFFEQQMRKKAKKIVFDFDDSIWLPNISDSNKKFEWLKNPLKTQKLISLADVVIAGNSFLAEYALKFNANVKVIPTTIDTDYHVRKKSDEQKNAVCIGWTGSHTTIQHFEHALPFLLKLKERFKDKIYFKVIGDASYENKQLDVKGISWKYETEIDDLLEFDIGIMPLPDNEWTKGKCGLKGLQYMALEISTVMSSVGVNIDIINEGINGFLADSDDEWIEKISRLVNDRQLRKQIGAAARQTVVEKYSVEAQREKYLNCLRSLLL